MKKFTLAQNFKKGRIADRIIVSPIEKYSKKILDILSSISLSDKKNPGS